MASKVQYLKLASLIVFAAIFLTVLISNNLSKVTGSENTAEPATAVANADDYVGSETCAACHDDQNKSFSATNT